MKDPQLIDNFAFRENEFGSRRGTAKLKACYIFSLTT